jgi:thiamine-phosphate pyrophosphorylase
VTARVVAILDHRVYPVDEIAPRLAAMLAAVPAGALHVQVRARELDGGPLLALARAVVASGAPTWVNDRLDVALAAGAIGVHLPERGLAFDHVLGVLMTTGRTLAIGRSVHAVTDVRARADVVHLGPIWATPSKHGVLTPLGPDVLRAARRVARGRLVAVGGVDSPERAREAASAGADAIAVIRAVWTASEPARAVAALCEAVDEGIARRAAALTST